MSAAPLTLTPLIDIPLVQPGDNLTEIILAALHASHLTLRDNDVLVLAQKIVSKAEGRLFHLSTVQPSPRAIALAAETEKDARLIELILQESSTVLRTRPGLIIVEHRLGFVCANAGIDHSNVAPPETSRVSGELENLDAEGWFLLLPENPDASAAVLRANLEAETGTRLGIMIIDSHGRAWREGTVGVCIGLSGLPGLVDLRGEQDLFGYELRVTTVGAADELAAAASLMMGQVAEGKPVVHARGFPYALREAQLDELMRPKEKDLFR